MKRPTIAISAAALGGVALSLVAFAPASGHGSEARAKLRGPDHTVAGTVTFESGENHTEVRLRIRQKPIESTALDAFHGFHIHANTDSANGSGCVADPAAASDTWFMAADGHWKADAEVHGHHRGDMPSVLILADGTAEVRFTLERLDIEQLVGRAVILHAKPDNFNNIPVGGLAGEYTPNGTGATDLTARTGNAGDRIACGVLQR